MLSVDKNKRRARAHSTGELKVNEKVNTCKDDSFMEKIDWDALPKNTFLKDNKSDIFSNIRHLQEGPQLLPEPLKARSRRNSAPPPRRESDRKTAHDDTDHHYPMTKITKRLYLGNDDDASDEAALRKEKITHVLSMVARKWDEKPRETSTFDWKPNIFDRSKDIKRMCVPLRDDGKSDVIKLLERKELWDFITDSQKKKKKLLIHCQMGQNRSPTMVMGFLMKHKHITFHKAWRMVKQKRIIVQPHVKYIKQLRTWDMYLHGSYSTPDDFLEMKVSGDGEDISVLHEHEHTMRMKDIMVSARKNLQEASTLNQSWDSSLDLGSPFSPENIDFFGSSKFITIEPHATFTDIEIASSSSESDNLTLD